MPLVEELIMKNIQNTKGMLAKLLATENITVQHANVPTGMFDLNSRTLYCPIWEDMTGDLYDLLMGHEIGHAKHTPAEGWHHVLSDKGMGFKTFLNVVEDCRIERKVKQEYPGIKKSFNSAYKKLFDRDFFGIKDLKDFNTLNLIDRINIEFKVGAFVYVPFSEEEQYYVDQVKNAETWEDVVKAANEIYLYVKNYESNKVQTQDQLQNMIDQGSFELDSNGSEDLDSNSFNMDSQNSDSDGEESDESSQGSEAAADASDQEAEEGSEARADQEADEESGDSQGSNEQTSKEGDVSDSSNENVGTNNSDVEPTSITDKIFRDKEETLNKSKANPITIKMPEPVLENIVVETSAILQKFNEEKKRLEDDLKYRGDYSNWSTYYEKNPPSLDRIINNCREDFNKENKNFISLLVKEFEMRKNAKQYARAKESKTGELDTRKLYKYRFNNDIFKKITTVDKGKSHGMVMLLDCSSSMSGHRFQRSLTQILALAEFCTKVSIPFEVYGFSDSPSANKIYDKKCFREDKSVHHKFLYSDNTYSLSDDHYSSSNDFILLKLISSDLSRKNYTEAFNILLLLAKYHHFTCWEWFGLSLSSTPYIPAVVSSIELCRKFKQKFKTDIINLIHLTDGEGTTRYHVNRSGFNSIILEDPKTNGRYYVEGFTANYFSEIARVMQKIHLIAAQDILKNIGVRTIGFFLCGMGAFKSKLRDNSEIDSRKSLENGFFNTEKVDGFEDYYYVVDNLNVKQKKVAINANIKKQVQTEFLNEQRNKVNTKVLVSKFAQSVAA
jgi:cobalamin biosynthesis protein CobT